ncbi:type VII secretion system-associated protein (plasmid) [Streptomyces sp. FXJ1.172]|uniref:type VII secretion system-associated protein n=1 Tax=Streptomyces sp. FXJ1.172 TaxID=710705 RepID=UPI0023DD53C4|nr:type VII secretion system-associated protein [Streptomyces sp. FXJ1.172]WEP00912.1 type VII secretion system-associated protein [Streptomyces sp. FXJ1.172]
MTDVARTPQHDEPLADVPDSIREAARVAPDHWFGIVDPAWHGEDNPPTWAVVGQYRSDADGEVVEWQYNDDYRPSPSANGWSAPTDSIDEAIQLAATGYGPEEDVFLLIVDAEVSVLLAPDGRPVEACSPDGAPVVPVFTSIPQLRSGGRYASRNVLVRDLIRDLAEETQLYVNPTGAVSMIVAPERLASATEEAGEQPAAAPRAEEDMQADEDALRLSVPAVPLLSDGRDRVRQVETLELPEPESESDSTPGPRPEHESSPVVDSARKPVTVSEYVPVPEPVAPAEPEADSEWEPEPPASEETEADDEFDSDAGPEESEARPTPVLTTEDYLVSILSGGVDKRTH